VHRRDPVARDGAAREIAALDTLLGRRRLEARRFDEAVERFRSALSYDEALEPARVGLAIALLRTEQHEYVLSETLAGLARHPQSADLHLLHGEALYRLNRFDEAAAAWRQSLALRPDPDLERRLASVERERAGTSTFRTSEAPHFTLQYDGERLPAAVEEEIVAALEEGYEEFARTLDHLPEATITVILYTRQMFRDITEAPSGVEGIFDGKVRLPMGGLGRVSPAARAVIRHELAHAFVHSKTRGAAPRWLHEGIAQWLEPRSARTHGARLAREARQRPPGAPVPFSYPSALSQVEYLVEAYGAHELLDLLDRLRDSGSVDAALRDTYRFDTLGLGAEWAQWLARAHPAEGR
jgi:tetratricopeptide (TPR) repeat protein